MQISRVNRTRLQFWAEDHRKTRAASSLHWRTFRGWRSEPLLNRRPQRLHIEWNCRKDVLLVIFLWYLCQRCHCNRDLLLPYLLCGPGKPLNLIHCSHFLSSGTPWKCWCLKRYRCQGQKAGGDCFQSCPRRGEWAISMGMVFLWAIFLQKVRQLQPGNRQDRGYPRSCILDLCTFLTRGK